MNMQTIQILFLVFDGIVELAPWGNFAETLNRVGYGAGESLARYLGILAVVCAGFCVFSPASILGPVLLTGYFGGTMASHSDADGPLFRHILLGFYLVMMWGGLWCDGSLREPMPLQS